MNVDEVLAQVVQAFETDQLERGRILLRQALQESNDSRIPYLLATDSAQEGRYDEALTLFEKAGQLNPPLPIAHLQQALLHLTLNQNDRAQAALQRIPTGNESDPIAAFRDGMLAMIQNNRNAAVKSLLKGIELNNINPALNKDMQILIDTITQPEQTGATAPDDKLREDADILLSAYKRTN
jgi:tetratricopeptide (TPR) repeat protein